VNYYDLFQNQVKQYPKKVFVIYNAASYTYQQIDEKCREIRAGISNLNNQTVFISSGDWVFQLTAFLAVQAEAGIPILLHYPMAEDSIYSLASKFQVNHLLTEEKICSLQLEVSVNFPHICMGVLTSGTTGLSKIWYRTYSSWTDFFPVQNHIFNISKDTLLLLHGSLSFTGNLNAALSVLYAGGTLVTVDRFNPAKWDADIAQFGISHLYFVPSKLQLIASALQQEHPNIRQIFTGSQLLSSATIKKLKKLVPNAFIHLYYGSSELSFLTYIEANELLDKPFSVGKPFPGVKIFAEQDILYVDTAYPVEGTDIPCPLQDHGYIDLDGHLILQGRKDDMVNISGYKVSIAHVERILLSMNGISDAAVFAYTDANNKVKLVAVVVSQLNRMEILETLKAQLYYLEIPGKIIFMESIPYGPAGKPDYETLRREVNV